MKQPHLVIERIDAYRVRCTDCGNQVTGLFATERRAEQAVEEKREHLDGCPVALAVAE
jgi:DNA-directed RNA polymerase subunit N (RpoN/RPB10)